MCNHKEEHSCFVELWHSLVHINMSEKICPVKYYTFPFPLSFSYWKHTVSTYLRKIYLYFFLIVWIYEKHNWIYNIKHCFCLNESFILIQSTYLVRNPFSSLLPTGTAMLCLGNSCLMTAGKLQHGVSGPFVLCLKLSNIYFWMGSSSEINWLISGIKSQ